MPLEAARSTFSRSTIIAAAHILASTRTHAGLDMLMLKLGVEDHVSSDGSKEIRVTALVRFAVKYPDTIVETIDGQITIGSAIVQEVIPMWERAQWSNWKTTWDQLLRGLDRDGFIVTNEGTLRRGLPQSVNLPEADDEIRSLLRQFSFLVPLGHIDQAVAAHTRGDWAAANSQLRSFVESLLDEIAGRCSPSHATPAPTGHSARQLLATCGFFIPGLNEWKGNGTGFMEAFFRRLHPHGSHPGLSDADDATFRLHIVLIVARLLLRRLAGIGTS
jgi:hypothetical protein